MSADLNGRMVLVTGASSGIGLATARGLAHRGATVVMVSRASGSGAAQTEALRRETGNAALYHLSADLSSLSDVRRAAAEFSRTFGHLDVLINNAGGFFPRRQLSPDGLELTFALNHLSPFLLTHLLLEKLLRGDAPRIVNVASRAERFGTLDFGDLALTNYGMWRAYGRSKLANLLFSYELARRLSGTSVTVNALHPGTVATSIGGPLGSLLMKLARPFFKTPSQGAETTLYLATSAEVAGKTGGYYSEAKLERSSAASYDRAAQARLWQISRELVGLSETEEAPLERLLSKSKDERSTP